MPVYRDDAVVLRTHKLGEADRIVTLLTRSHGIVRAVAKGVRRTSSKFGARLEPFMVVDVQLYTGRSLDVVTQAVSLGAFGAEIASDYSRYAAASVMVEAAEHLGATESTVQNHLLLVGGLRALARREHDTQLILDAYLLRALALGGWAPSFGDCVRCGATGPHRSFVVQLGGVVCAECAPPGAPRVDAAVLGLLGALLSGDWEIADASASAARDAASAIVSAYAQWHLERGLRSLRQVERDREDARAERAAGVR